MMNDPEKYYYIQPCSIGDIIKLGGYTRAFLDKVHKKSAVMIAQQRYEPINIDFDGVSEIRYLNSTEMNFVAEYIHATKQYFGANFMFAGAPQGYVKPPNLNDMQIFKQIFKLPPDAPFYNPRVRDIPDDAKLRFSQQYVLNKEKTIIIAPRANTPMTPPSIVFWQNLIENLRQKGYVIYTNIGKDVVGRVDNVLPNTSPLYANINEIFYLIDKVKCIIGVRSGLLDLLAFSKGNIICLSPSEWPHADLKLIYPDTPSKICSLFFNWEFFPKLNELIAQFEIESMSVANVKHKKIAPENLFFDEQNLLAAVLRAVEAL